MEGSNSSVLKGRYSAEKRFKLYGVFAVSLALGAVIFLLFTIFSTGYSAFWRTEFQVEIQFNGDYLGITQESSDQEVREANFLGLFRKNLAEQNNDVPRRELRKLFAMFSESAADDLREMVITNRSILGTTQKLKVLASSSVDMIVKGQAPREIEEKRRVLNDFQLGLLDRWTAEGRRSSSFNHRFFTNGDSRSPELAGLGGAIAGSFWTLMVCLILSFPMGVAAAIYLEEYAPKNRLTEIIEVNINNLAAVPSIIFGLLGLALLPSVHFINSYLGVEWYNRELGNLGQLVQLGEERGEHAIIDRPRLINRDSDLGLTANALARVDLWETLVQASRGRTLVTTL